MDIRSQLGARKSEKQDEKTEFFQVSLPARGASVARKKERGPLHTAELRDLLNAEERKDLNLMEMLKERQQQRWALRER